MKGRNQQGGKNRALIKQPWQLNEVSTEKRKRDGRSKKIVRLKFKQPGKKTKIDGAVILRGRNRALIKQPWQLKKKFRKTTKGDGKWKKIVQLKLERPGKTPKKVWALVVPKKMKGQEKNKDTKEVKIVQKKSPKMHTTRTTQVFKKGRKKSPNIQTKSRTQVFKKSHKKIPKIDAKKMAQLLRKGLKKRPKIEVRKKTMRKSVKMVQRPKVVKKIPKAHIYRSPEHRQMVKENLKKSQKKNSKMQTATQVFKKSQKKSPKIHTKSLTQVFKKGHKKNTKIQLTKTIQQEGKNRALIKQPWHLKKKLKKEHKWEWQVEENCATQI